MAAAAAMPIVASRLVEAESFFMVVS